MAQVDQNKAGDQQPSNMTFGQLHAARKHADMEAKKHQPNPREAYAELHQSLHEDKRRKEARRQQNIAEAMAKPGAE